MASQLIRRIGLIGGTAALGLALVVGAGVLAEPSDPATSTSESSVAAASADPLSRSIAATQDRLSRVPRDWQGWATLGAAYVEQARVTADPSFYELADGALAKSMEIQPVDNFPALSGMAALAAARHDFTDALQLADRSLVVNEFNAATHGIRGDALIELGRYEDAIAAFQRMLDLRPGTPSYSRASYAWELRGNIPAAVETMTQARDAAATPADAAFASYQLAELALGQGDVATAQRHVTEGLQRNPSSADLRAGRAKVEVAKGETEAALATYAELVATRPLPSYLVAYGELLESLGRDDEAEAQYAVVRSVQQLFAAQGVSVDQELAVFEADHGDAKQALAAAEQVWRKQRGAVFVEDAYAWALHVNGRDKEALAHADAALRLGTRSALLHFHRGIIRQALGQRDGARADLAAALKINPHFSPLRVPVARAALAELAPRP